jgi:hypothetical protein
MLVANTQRDTRDEGVGITVRNLKDSPGPCLLLLLCSFNFNFFLFRAHSYTVLYNEQNQQIQRVCIR